MRPLPHSYTNDTRGDGRLVEKRYEGPDAEVRRERERTVLRALRGRLPVPPLLENEHRGALAMAFVAGVPGQELIDAGHAATVLRACGLMLRRIHDLDVREILPAEPARPGTVLVHGDYGPNNLLLDAGTATVTAVLDWEWAHPGRPVEDLAWCEWIVRTHHGRHAGQLDGFFDAYGQRPAWAERHAAMLAQCRSLLDLSRRWNPDAVRLWRHRLDATATWAE